MKERKFFIIILVLISLFACQAVALNIPEDGLVAYYSFDDGTATDNSGHGYDGQNHGAVPISGVSGNALFFDGTNDYINVTNSPDFNPPSFTIGAWAKVIGYGDDYQHIVSKHVNYLGVREGYCLQYMKISDNLNFFTGEGPSGGYNHINSGIVEPGDWHYVAGTYDGTTGEKRLYIDGISVGSSSSSVVHSPNDLIIGCGGQFGSHFPQFSDFFLGSIDEVIFYNRSFTAVEISDLYDSYMIPRYVIRATSAGGGRISPSGDIVVLSGEDQSFDLQFSKPYQLAVITIDDITIDLKNLVVTFNNVFSDHTISTEYASPSNKPAK